MSIRLGIAAITLIATSVAVASTPVGFTSQPGTLPGSAPDEYLSADAVRAAALDGIRDAGVAVDTSLNGQPVIIFTWFQSNLPPGTIAAREVAGSFELQVTGTAFGKKQSVALCTKTVATWHGGDATHSQMHASQVLADVREQAKVWATWCFSPAQG